MHQIYVLTDDRGNVRYCDQTTKPLSVRLREHVAEAERGGTDPLSRWIRTYGRPRIERVTAVADIEAAGAVVDAWRAFCRCALGFDLLSSTPLARIDRARPTTSRPRMENDI